MNKMQWDHESFSVEVLADGTTRLRVSGTGVDEIRAAVAQHKITTRKIDRAAWRIDRDRLWEEEKRHLQTIFEVLTAPASPLYLLADYFHQPPSIYVHRDGRWDVKMAPPEEYFGQGVVFNSSNLEITPRHLQSEKPLVLDCVWELPLPTPARRELLFGICWDLVKGDAKLFQISLGEYVRDLCVAPVIETPRLLHALGEIHQRMPEGLDGLFEHVVGLHIPRLGSRFAESDRQFLIEAVREKLGRVLLGPSQIELVKKTS